MSIRRHTPSEQHKFYTEPGRTTTPRAMRPRVQLRVCGRPNRVTRGAGGAPSALAQRPSQSWGVGRGEIDFRPPRPSSRRSFGAQVPATFATAPPRPTRPATRARRPRRARCVPDAGTFERSGGSPCTREAWAWTSTLSRAPRRTEGRSHTYTDLTRSTSASARATLSPVDGSACRQACPPATGVSGWSRARRC